MTDVRLIDVDRLLDVLMTLPNRNEIWSCEVGQSDVKPGMTVGQVIRGRLRLLVVEADLRPSTAMPRWTMGDLVVMIAELVAKDSCSLDHHGNCQAHGLEKNCPHARAKRILQDFGVTY